MHCQVVIASNQLETAGLGEAVAVGVFTDEQRCRSWPSAPAGQPVIQEHDRSRLSWGSCRWLWHRQRR